MAKGLIWATADNLARNRGRVLSLYRQLLRSLNSPNLPLNLAARLSKKAEVRAIFMLASEDRSLHNIEDLIDAAEYSLSLLRKCEIPKLNQYNTNSPCFTFIVCIACIGLKTMRSSEGSRSSAVASEGQF
ncbi:hypothetical protein RJ639_029069 [Escallonia herrerae]|uniref:LYR motif containing domain-containing protein n=1 Tax=Escallonia herrerae TaxID=1293975 RepID=A0AA88X7H6_9ASTE|nr:hypothetical protein RJ639_029069 [Escallonia herrerae]